MILSIESLYFPLTLSFKIVPICWKLVFLNSLHEKLRCLGNSDKFYLIILKSNRKLIRKEI